MHPTERVFIILWMSWCALRWNTYKFMEAVGYSDKFGDAVTQKLLHIVTTSRFESIFEIIRHGMSREEATEYIELLSRYHRCGFIEIFGKGLQ